jgi:hypothetical protein
MTPPVGSISGAKRPDGDDATEGAATVEAPADADDCMVICVSRAVSPRLVLDLCPTWGNARPQESAAGVSVRRLAATDVQRLTRDLTGVIGRQEEHGVGDVGVRCIRPMGIPELHSSYASS